MPSAVDSRRIIKNAGYRLSGVILDYTSSLPITGGLTGTAATLDKDGAGFVAATNTGSVIEIGTTGFFTLDLTATEMTADLITVNVSASNSNAIKHLSFLRPEACLESGIAQGGGASTITLRAAASSTVGIFVPATIEIVRGTGAGQIRGIIAYNGAQVVTVDRAWTTAPDSTSVYLIHSAPYGVFDSVGLQQVNAAQINANATAAATMALMFAGGVIVDTLVASPAPTSSQFAGGGTATLSSVDLFYNNSMVGFLSGVLAGKAFNVTSYTGATKVFVLDTPMYVLPSAGDTYMILSHQN